MAARVSNITLATSSSFQRSPWTGAPAGTAPSATAAGAAHIGHGRLQALSSPQAKVLGSGLENRLMEKW